MVLLGNNINRTIAVFMGIFAAHDPIGLVFAIGNKFIDLPFQPVFGRYAANCFTGNGNNNNTDGKCYKEKGCFFHHGRFVYNIKLFIQLG